MIAAFVKERRDAELLTQKELAQKTGVSFRTIQQIEACKNTKEKTVNKVLQYFGYKVVVKTEIIKTK